MAVSVFFKDYKFSFTVCAKYVDIMILIIIFNNNITTDIYVK